MGQLLYDKASLVNIPSRYRDGKLYNIKPSNADFEFERGTGATRVNEDGLIETFYGEVTNVLLQSNQFDTSWQSIYINTPTNGFSGYDGLTNAWKIEANATGYARINQSFNLNGVHTFSVYAKSAEWDYIGLFFLGVARGVVFSLIDGSVQNPIVNYPEIYSNAEYVGDGWYKITIAHTLNGAGEVRIYPCETNVYNGNSTVNQGVYIQDAQLESGYFATPYIETTTETVTVPNRGDTPRIDYTDPNNPSLLLEPQRTNIVPVSEGVPEATGAVTKTINNGTSPEGGINSLKVQKSGNSSNDRILPIDSYNATLISGNDYTISCFVKNIDVRDNGVTTIACRVSGNTLFRSGFEWDGQSLSYLATGFNSGPRSNVFVEDYGNDWWRIGFTFEADGTSGNFELDVDRRFGSDTTSIETWGWQIEEGSYATSYIPTNGSAETRLKDELSNIDMTSITGDSYTIFFDYKDAQRGSPNTANWMYFYNTSNQLLTYMYGGTLMMHSTSGEDYTNFTFGDGKVAFVYDGTNVKYFLNGTLIKTVTASTRWDLGALEFSTYSDTSTSTIKYNSVLVFPEALEDHELERLTSPTPLHASSFEDLANNNGYTIL